MSQKPKVIIYTDGGCVPNPGIGGWAALLIFEDQKRELSGGEESSTNNRMELTAVISALESLEQPYKIDLYTDSQYVKNGITQWIDNWIRKNWRDVKNPDLWQILHQATQRHQIQWHWVKGHAGVEHNERVDQLAMQEIDKLSGSARVETESSEPYTKIRLRIHFHISHSPETRDVGWAARIISDNEEILSGSASNISSNRMALQTAAEILRRINLPSQIDFYTDSEYLQKGISDWIHGWQKRGWQTAAGEPVKNQDLWQELLDVSKPHKIQWKYSRGNGGQLDFEILELSTAARERLGRT